MKDLVMQRVYHSPIKEAPLKDTPALGSMPVPLQSTQIMLPAPFYQRDTPFDVRIYRPTAQATPVDMWGVFARQADNYDLFFANSDPGQIFIGDQPQESEMVFVVNDPLVQDAQATWDQVRGIRVLPTPNATQGNTYISSIKSMVCVTQKDYFSTVAMGKDIGITKPQEMKLYLAHHYFADFLK